MTNQATTEKALTDLEVQQKIILERPDQDPNKAALVTEYVNLIKLQTLSIQLAKEASARSQAAVTEATRKQTDG